MNEEKNKKERRKQGFNKTKEEILLIIMHDIFSMYKKCGMKSNEISNKYEHIKHMKGSFWLK